MPRKFTPASSLRDEGPTTARIIETGGLEPRTRAGTFYSTLDAVRAVMSEGQKIQRTWPVLADDMTAQVNVPELPHGRATETDKFPFTDELPQASGAVGSKAGRAKLASEVGLPSDPRSGKKRARRAAVKGKNIPTKKRSTAKLP